MSKSETSKQQTVKTLHGQRAVVRNGYRVDRRGVGVAAVALPTGVRREIERYKALREYGAHRDIFATVDAAIGCVPELLRYLDQLFDDLSSLDGPVLIPLDHVAEQF